MISMIKSRIDLFRTKRKWRRLNPHNHTTADSIFDPKYVEVGRYTYGPIKVFNWGEKRTLRIGDFCSVAKEVTFLLSCDHYTDHISSFPFRVECLGEECESISKGDIIVGDDVWIGYRSTILSGVRIGQGAIVAAGSVVVKDVPPYAIVGGVPARIIRYRFDEEIIKSLLKVDYKKLTKEQIEIHINELYTSLKNADQLVWMPYKEGY